jgi:L-lactate dehydrogenase complex protein LldG
MTSRENILRRLRQAQPLLPETNRPNTAMPPQRSLDECLARFSVEAAALGIDYFVERSADDVRTRVASVVGSGRVLSWNFEYLPYDCGQVLTNATFGSAPRAAQAAAEFGVTGCDAAIAETASLVLFSAHGKGRTVSLLPPVHVAIVEPQRLCFSMAEMFVLHGQRMRDSASCTVITGPSRTADIELTLTLGIHGPGRVVIVVGP